MADRDPETPAEHPVLRVFARIFMIVAAAFLLPGVVVAATGEDLAFLLLLPAMAFFTQGMAFLAASRQ